MSIKITALSLSALCVCLLACKGSGQQGEGAVKTPEQQTASTRLDSIQKVVDQTTQTYKAMDNPTLIQKLVEQSKKQKEPFNSLAFRELKGRKDVNTDTLASLVAQLRNGDALLPLLLIRRLNDTAYLRVSVELRAGVLTDALDRSKTFNTWGLPHLYLEDAAKALIECGRSTLPALGRMLTDTRPAPVFGSQQYMEYKKYQYRLCDYALFFIEQIQGHTDFVMPVSPADRDSLIKNLKV